MSQNIPPRKQRVKQIDYKVRTGFTEEQHSDWLDWVSKNGKNATRIVHNALLSVMGKTPQDIREEGE